MRFKVVVIVVGSCFLLDCFLLCVFRSNLTKTLTSFVCSASNNLTTLLCNDNSCFSVSCESCVFLCGIRSVKPY